MITKAEAKKIYLENNEVIKYLKTLDKAIIKLAESGMDNLEILTSEVPGNEMYTKAGMVSIISEFFSNYGFPTTSNSNNTKVTVWWD